MKAASVSPLRETQERVVAEARKGSGAQYMDIESIDQIIDTHGAEPSALIQILLDIQADHHWLPGESLERVSERLGVAMTRIMHIATFYKAFSLVPKGRHEIHCLLYTSD